MTIETCKIRLELAKKRENKEEITFWEERLARKTGTQETPQETPKTNSKTNSKTKEKE